MSSSVNMSSSDSPIIAINQNSTIILEIDNLLTNWPTYIVNYTPEQPGPLKIILRLKDIRKHAVEDDGNDSDSDSDDEKNTPAMAKVAKQRVKNASVTIHIPSSDEDGKDNDSENDKTLTVDAIPVAIHGIPKETIPLRPKFFDLDDTVWPPVRPRTLRALHNNKSASGFTFLKTFLAPVKVTDN